MIWHLLLSILVLHLWLIRKSILNFEFGAWIEQFRWTFYVESNHLLFDELSHVLRSLILTLFLFDFLITLQLVRIIILLIGSKQLIRRSVGLFFIFSILIILLLVTLWLFLVQSCWKVLCTFFRGLVIYLICFVTWGNLVGIIIF